MWNKVKSSIADHAGQFNHFINWDAARILQMKSDAGTRYIFESLKGKGALDNFNICLFISNSTEDLKLNEYWNFQLILPMRFYLMRYFVNSIIFRVSHRLLYCVFIEVDFEK